MNESLGMQLSGLMFLHACFYPLSVYLLMFCLFCPSVFLSVFFVLRVRVIYNNNNNNNKLEARSKTVYDVNFAGGKCYILAAVTCFTAVSNITRSNSMTASCNDIQLHTLVMLYSGLLSLLRLWDDKFLSSFAAE